MWELTNTKIERTKSIRSTSKLAQRYLVLLKNHIVDIWPLGFYFTAFLLFSFLVIFSWAPKDWHSPSLKCLIHNSVLASHSTRRRYCKWVLLRCVVSRKVLQDYKNPNHNSPRRIERRSDSGSHGRGCWGVHSRKRGCIPVEEPKRIPIRSSEPSQESLVKCPSIPHMSKSRPAGRIWPTNGLSVAPWMIFE